MSDGDGMKRTDAIAAVVDLACLTEDRSPVEQRALLDVALQADLERGRFVVRNKAPEPPRLVEQVLDTYDPSSGRRVGLTAPQQRGYDALVERWSPCSVCEKPLGMHGPDECADAGGGYAAVRS